MRRTPNFVEQRVIAETLGVFAGGYALMLGGLAIFQRDMIYHPGATLPDPGDVGVPEMVPMSVRTTDNLLLTGWYAPPADAGALTVLYCHGNARTLAERAHKARRLMDAGLGVLLVGYRGYGGNPGHPTEPGLYADARAALGWLRSREVPAERIVVYGESLGTGIATQMAVENPELGALVLEAPFTRLADLAPPYLLPGLAPLLLLDQYDTASKIPGLDLPILVVHGDHDGVVPVAMGRTLVKAANGRAEGVFLAPAGHNDLWEHGAAEAVLAFLGRIGGDHQ